MSISLGLKARPFVSLLTNTSKKIKINTTSFLKNKTTTSFLKRTTFFGLSTYFSYQTYTSFKSNNVNALGVEVDHHDDHFHLLEALTMISGKISPKAMLKLFQTMVEDLGEEAKISLSLLEELFKMVGVSDPKVAEHLFETMDWDHSGYLETSEVAAVMTLFQRGGDKDRYKFLFNCIDLNGNNEVDKNEFRRLLTALLEAHYKLQGLNDPFLPQEVFSNVTKKEYHTVAKWRANRLVMDIFSYADVNRDGVLSMKEFLKWCTRGGKEVDMLRDILADTFSGVAY